MDRRFLEPGDKGQTIPSPGELGLPPKTVNLEHLRRIMSLRLEETFELIERELSHLGFSGSPARRGVYLRRRRAHPSH